MAVNQQSIRLAKALMYFRGLSLGQVARGSGISPENLEAWLKGVNNTLSPASYFHMFAYLGVNKKGLLPEGIHHWVLNFGRSGEFSEHQKNMLEWVNVLLPKGEMIEVREKGVKPTLLNRDRLRIFMIRGSDESGAPYRVVLSMKGQWRDLPALSPEMIPGTQWRIPEGKKGGQPSCLELEPLYWRIVRDCSMTRSEFDDVFSSNYLKCSWGDLRLIARERDITPTQIAEWILQNEREQNGHNDEAVMANVSSSVVISNSVFEKHRSSRFRRVPPTEQMVPSHPSEPEVVSNQTQPVVQEKTGTGQHEGGRRTYRHR